MNDADRIKSNTSKFIMVTGGSSGIGRATAGRLADAGHVVFAAARRASALESLAREHPNARPVVLDVTNRASIDQAFEQIQAATDGYGLDALVNAAGRLILGPVEAIPDELGRAQFDVNLFGLVAVTRVFLPGMRERGSGRIVNLSSVLGRFALPGTGLYSATKFAIEAVSDALRMELAPFGIRVVLVEPGVTETSLYEAAASRLRLYDEGLEPYRASWTAGFGFPVRLLKGAAHVDRVAETVVKATLARNPRARYRPGFRNRMNIRLLTGLPTTATDRIKMGIADIARTPRPAATAGPEESLSGRARSRADDYGQRRHAS